MQDCDILLHAGILITQNENRDILENAALAIRDGKIAAIGPAAAIKEAWQPAQVLDYSQDLVMPGLINAHTHAAMTFLRGKAEDLPLMDWLNTTVFPAEARLTPEIVRIGSLLGYAEMLATGTTACIDMYIHEEAALEAAEMAGLRCMGGEAVFNFPSAACANYRDALRITRELAQKYKDHDRIKVAVAPHSIYTTTTEILKACHDLAEELDLRVHIHLAETNQEIREVLARHKYLPVRYLVEFNLLRKRLIAAHLVCVDDVDIFYLLGGGVVGVHNPTSNMKLTSGIAPVSRMLSIGLPVALGTDGPASNNQINMFAEMRQAGLSQKIGYLDSSVMPAQTVLDMATIGGAAAFGMPGLGRLTEGSPADCIALNLQAPNLQPLHNAVSQAVYAATGHECRMTMVAGEVLYRDGVFTHFDYPALLGETKKLLDF